LAFAVRRSRWYALLGLHAGSLVIAVVGLVWLIERALDLTLDQFAALLREAAFARLWPVWLGAALALGLWSFARLRRVRWLSPLAAIVVIAGAGYALRVANVERAALQRELAGQLAAAREDMQRREWSRTEALLAGAARIAALLGDERAQADALARRGSLDIARAELGAARHAHERALALYDGLGDERACASSQRALGLIAHLAGDTTLAARAYRRALAIHERLGLDALAAGDAAELAAIYQYSNQHTEAQAMTTQARELARRARGLPHTAD
jgi:hypothetical protein